MRPYWLVCFVFSLSAASLPLKAQTYPSPPSIRDQLEGRVEMRDTAGNTAPSGLEKGSLSSSDPALRDSVPSLNGRESHWRGSGNAKADGFSSLQGRVEDRNQLQKLYRPNGDPLGKSVKVLSGINALQSLDARVENDSFDSVLDTSNFNLPVAKTELNNNYKAQNPRADHHDLINTYGEMYTSRSPGHNSFAWTRMNMHDRFRLYEPYGFNDPWGRSAWDWEWEFERSFDNSFWEGSHPMERNHHRWRQERLRADFSQSPTMARIQAPLTLYPLPPLNLNQGWGNLQARPQIPVYDERNISWDTWYQRISAALYQHWQGRGKEPGDAVLRITVRRPRQIQAQIVRSNNQNESFKQELMAAVSALNGNPVLDFPAQSQKSILSFESAFSAGLGTRAGAYSERSGELEKIRTRRK